MRERERFSANSKVGRKSQTIGGSFVGDVTVNIVGVSANVSPMAFRLWASHYIRCYEAFDAMGKFSPVPYFLLCRAIELSLKAIHLKSISRAQVKSKYSHNIMALYDALGNGAKVLSTHESDVLLRASNVYRGKGFEYFSPDFALEGYKSFPDLRILEDVARKLMARCEEEDLS